ncbi:hypothetical protein VSQ32_08035 [Lachnospiraceae bacterium KK002]
MCKMKRWMETLTDVVEMTRKEYVLTITTSLLGGIIIGYIFAPRRIKYTTVGCHNGSKNRYNGNGNGYKGDLPEEWDEPDEEDDVIHFN